jgi:hypothetical protein
MSAKKSIEEEKLAADATETPFFEGPLGSFILGLAATIASGCAFALGQNAGNTMVQAVFKKPAKVFALKAV